MKTAGRRESSPRTWQLMVLGITSLMPLMSTTRRLLIRLLMTSSRTTRHGVATAGQPTEREKTGNPGAMTITETVMPVHQRDDGRSAIVTIIEITSEVEMANLDVAKTASLDVAKMAMLDGARRNATIGIAAETTVENDAGVATEIEDTTDGTMNTATVVTITRRHLPIPLPDAWREVAPGRGKIQSHTPVVTSLLAVVTEAEIGEFLYPYKSVFLIPICCMSLCFDGLVMC